MNVQQCKQWGPVPLQTALAPGVPWDSGVKILGLTGLRPGLLSEGAIQVAGVPRAAQTFGMYVLRISHPPQLSFRMQGDVYVADVAM